MELPNEFKFHHRINAKVIHQAVRNKTGINYTIHWKGDSGESHSLYVPEDHVQKLVFERIWTVLKEDKTKKIEENDDLQKPLSDVDNKIKELEDAIKTYSEELDDIDTKRKGLVKSWDDCHYNLSILRSARDILYANNTEKTLDSQEEKEAVYVIYRKGSGYSAGGEYQPDLNCPEVTVYDNGLEASLDVYYNPKNEEIIPVHKDKNGWLTLK